MTDIAEVTSQLEAFFQKRCPGGDSLKIAGYEPITGGYSRAMARVWVEDSDGRRGYIVRADPPPGTWPWRSACARSVPASMASM